jgi:multidrug efflux pump subunit AcrB
MRAVVGIGDQLLTNVITGALPQEGEVELLAPGLKVLEEIARQYKVRLKIAEVPPGPPVLQTLVGEVYGPPGASYDSIIKAADRIKENFLKTKGVVDVDTTVETAEPRFRFLVDRQKAALKECMEFYKTVL